MKICVNTERVEIHLCVCVIRHNMCMCQYVTFPEIFYIHTTGLQILYLILVLY